MLFIGMTSRSGSSMVAAVFAAHGFWYGRDVKTYTPRGTYRTFEDQSLKGWLRQHVTVRSGQFCQPAAARQLADYVAGYPEPWLFKGAIEYWPLFHALDSHLVLVRRDLEQTARSVADTTRGCVRRGRADVRARYALMDQARAAHGGVDVFTDQLVQRDYRSLRAAFRYAGVRFDQRIADRVIRPEKWHDRAL